MWYNLYFLIYSLNFIVDNLFFRKIKQFLKINQPPYLEACQDFFQVV